MVVFDLTRLLLRVRRTHLTGIDRVDLQYFNFLRNYRQTIFIVQKKQYYDIVPESELKKIDEFFRGGSLYSKNGRNNINNAFRLLTSSNLLNKLKRVKKSTISDRLKSVLKNNHCVYINSSHTLDDEIFIRKLKRFNCRIYVFIHDLIPIFYPEYYSLSTHLEHKNRVVLALSNADYIFTNSLHTKKTLITFSRKEKISFNETNIINNGLGYTVSSGLRKPEIVNKISDNPYFVILGTIEPKKNHMLLLNIWKRINHDLKSNCPHLLVIGKRGWENQNILSHLDRSESLKTTVHELSNIKDNEVHYILKNARALLFPSFAEGWGIPITEALSEGCPVICSNLSVFREVAGDNARYIDPIDGLLWESTIKEFLALDIKTEETNRIKRTFTPRSWEQHFDLLSYYLQFE